MNYYYITGTSKGIGKALAEELLKSQENIVVGIARTQSITAKNYRHVDLDLSSTDAVARFKFDEHKDAKEIVLINNAATLGEVKHLGDLDQHEIAKAFNVNIAAPAILMNGFISQYKKHTAKRLIINLTSGAATSPYDGWSLYCAGKASIDMLSRVAAAEQELEGTGIKVLAIAPGVVDTGMQTAIRSTDQKGFSRKQKFIELHENRQLYDAHAVAKEFVSIMQHPEKVKDVVHRVVL